MRITGGSDGGRRLRAPAGQKTRPTSARTREAIFDVLAARYLGGGMAAVRVLDLYAGAGTLGLEALSRGAAACVFIDQAASAVAAVRHNLGLMAGSLARQGAPAGTRVLRAEVLRELPRLGARAERFELIFADPPYAGPEVDRVVAAVGEANLLAEHGVLVVEHAARRAAPAAPEGLVAESTRRYGDSAVTFYVHPEVPDVPDDPGDPP
jgi:16S rRNA (guanine(966)-N(2))-methyltransferase RsmD